MAHVAKKGDLSLLEFEGPPEDLDVRMTANVKDSKGLISEITTTCTVSTTASALTCDGLGSTPLEFLATTSTSTTTSDSYIVDLTAFDGAEVLSTVVDGSEDGFEHTGITWKWGFYWRFGWYELDDADDEACQKCCEDDSTGGYDGHAGDFTEESHLVINIPFMLHCKCTGDDGTVRRPIDCDLNGNKI